MANVDDKILEEARWINELFPEYSIDIILRRLNTYRMASNRVILVLWKLMPVMCPKPQYQLEGNKSAPKRKSSSSRDQVKVESSASSSKKSRSSDESGENSLATSSKHTTIISSANLESKKPPIQFYQMPSSSRSQMQEIQIESSNEKKKSRPAENVPGASSSKTDEIFYNEIYDKLRDIFPNIDPAFIEEKCQNPPFSIEGRNKEELICMFIELLL
ncbi:uncharacterized protein LOC122502765 [Leptopilina heterotoma]|uniref:uncharacterized protein LOC122502765 n=1 Tax=Leptopilina heterotoma TaxID=63436 RepID=UPI001CA89EEC|nr:uncharacterized protein LOC122502765 [Leptopilina heterotoma]